MDCRQVQINKFCRELQSKIVEDIIVGSYTGSNLTMELAKNCNVDLFNIDVGKIEDQLEPSPFGHFQDTKFDPNVRKSNELKLQDASIDLTKLGHHIMAENGFKNFIVKPYKLIVYRKGDFFATHTDTYEPSLVKSLVIHLPTLHVGGALTFNEWNPSKYHVDGALNYYIFDIDHPHQVLPVIDGVRVSITFKCFEINELPGLVKCTKINTIKQDFIADFDFSQFVDDYLYTNTFVYYPNIELLINICKKYNIAYKHVYFSTKNGKLNPSNVQHVYDKLDQSEELENEYQDEKISFEALVKKGNKYLVKHHLDLGMSIDRKHEHCTTRSFSYYYGHTGNSAIEARYKLVYMEGVLLNPFPIRKRKSLNDDCQEKKSKSDDDSEDTKSIECYFDEYEESDHNNKTDEDYDGSSGSESSEVY